jgi:hypothetical protein
MAESFVRGFVAAISWSVGFLTRALLLRAVVAALVLFFGVVVTLYALWFGVMLWFITGRFGIAREVAKKEHVERISIVLLVLSLVAVLLLQRNSPLHAATVGALAALGAALWLRRAEALRLSRERMGAGVRLPK